MDSCVGSGKDEFLMTQLDILIEYMQRIGSSEGIDSGAGSGADINGGGAGALIDSILARLESFRHDRAELMDDRREAQTGADMDTGTVQDTWLPPFSLYLHPRSMLCAPAPGVRTHKPGGSTTNLLSLCGEMTANYPARRRVRSWRGSFNSSSSSNSNSSSTVVTTATKATVRMTSSADAFSHFTEADWELVEGPELYSAGNQRRLKLLRSMVLLEPDDSSGPGVDADGAISTGLRKWLRDRGMVSEWNEHVETLIAEPGGAVGAVNYLSRLLLFAARLTSGVGDRGGSVLPAVISTATVMDDTAVTILGSDGQTMHRVRDRDVGDKLVAGCHSVMHYFPSAYLTQKQNRGTIFSCLIAGHEQMNASEQRCRSRLSNEETSAAPAQGVYPSPRRRYAEACLHYTHAIFLDSCRCGNTQTNPTSFNTDSTTLSTLLQQCSSGEGGRPSTQQPLPWLCLAILQVLLANRIYYNNPVKYSPLVTDACACAVQYASCRRNQLLAHGYSVSVNDCGVTAILQLIVQQEVLYNFGRIYMELGLGAYAAQCFRQALQGFESYMSQQFAVKSSGSSSTRLGLEPYLLTAECAHNLVCLYRGSGDSHAALEIMTKYLVY